MLKRETDFPGESSCAKLSPCTVISSQLGTVRQKSRKRPINNDPGSALITPVRLSASRPVHPANTPDAISHGLGHEDPFAAKAQRALSVRLGDLRWDARQW
jgi:hypothetical protein